MSALLKFEVAATWIECANCGISFGLTSATERRLRERHENFFCPKGHCNVFKGETEAERIRKQLTAQLEAERQSTTWWRCEAQTAKKRESAVKTKLTKMKRRVEAGVCPHCNRTFQQLAAHMQSQHKEEIHADESKSA